jgi:hypothetical protein
MKLSLLQRESVNVTDCSNVHYIFESASTIERGEGKSNHTHAYWARVTSEGSLGSLARGLAEEPVLHWTG